MASIELLGTAPSSARRGISTSTGSRSNSTTISSPFRSLSPRNLRLPLSPPAGSPEPVQFEEAPSTVATRLNPSRVSSPSVLERCTSPKSPNSRVTARNPPPRPARPPTALPNIRPTISLSPFLVSSLPPADRPLLSHCLTGKSSFSTSSTSPSQPTFSSKSSTNDRRSCYSSLAPPSPCFFGATGWPTSQLRTGSSAHSSSLAPSLPARSPRRPALPTIHSTHSKPSGPRKARHHSRSTNSASASASSRNSQIPSPHPHSPPPFPPPTAPLPPTPPYINTTSNSESSLTSPSHEKQLHTHQPHQHHPPFRHALADAESALLHNDADEAAATWRTRHKRHLWMLGTAALVALLVGGIMGGVVWKLGNSSWR